MDTHEVTPDQVAHVLELEEGHFIDLKAIEIQPAKLTRSLSAFANSDGGELYIGVDEDSHTGRGWRGFFDTEDANGHVQAFEQLFPLGSGVEYEFLRSHGDAGLVMHIIVHKARDIVGALDTKPYVRRGAQNLPADTPQGLEQLRRAKGIVSYESQTLAEDTEPITIHSRMDPHPPSVKTDCGPTGGCPLVPRGGRERDSGQGSLLLERARRRGLPRDRGSRHRQALGKGARGRA